MNIARELVDYCASIEFEMLPNDVIEAAKVQILDCLGVGLAGVKARGIAELVHINSAWGGREESAVIGHNLSLPAPNAAQINATIMHARDFDDGHPAALVHPGAISVATALALAEQAGSLSGKDCLAAVAMGTDLICRLGMAVQSDQPKSVTGWHFTALFGFPASSAVAGRILRLSPEKMNGALAIAYHQCAGSAQAMIDGALTKRLGVGFAVRGGITAALLAAEGVSGASGWLEGEAGLYRQYFGSPCNGNALLSDLGLNFEGANVGTKRYPCCGIVHPFIDATLQLIRGADFDVEEIEEIRVWHGEGTRFLVEPRKTKQQPVSIVDAQFSVPWGVAAALTAGKVTLEHFTDEGIRNEKIRDLSCKVTAQLDESMTRLDSLEAGRVELRLAGGRKLTTTCENMMNNGGGRMPFDECVEKFYECAAFSGMGLSDMKLTKAVERIKNFENLSDVSELVRLLQPEQ
ncbi:MAG: MmgE/PrpD family protein [Gammaproteobacteria bacterium]|nr:MmgE/PrpD family protein [Gammaproteobacteria bacterium]